MPTLHSRVLHGSGWVAPVRRQQVHAPRARARAAAAAPTTTTPTSTTSTLDWPAIEAAARAAAGPTLNGYTVVGHGAQPASAPSPVLPVDDDGPTRDSAAPIIFFRDTNGWCPYAARVWLALEHLADAGVEAARYEVCAINLREKQAFYPKLVSTSKVPAILLASADQLAAAGPAGVPAAERELVFESLDVLARLARPDVDAAGVLSPPGSEAATRAALALVDTFGSAGYGLVRSAAAAANGAAGAASTTTPPSALPPPPPLDEARAAFEAALAEWEALLASTPGPFIAGEAVSLADFAFAPMAERLAVLLPAAAGTAVRGRADAPHVSAWYDALDGVPAYRRAKGDPATHRAVFSRIMGVGSAAEPYVPADAAGAGEAAAKLALNRAAIIADAAKNAGVPAGSEPAIEVALARLAGCLVSGQPGKPSEEAAGNAVTAAVCAFLPARVSAPRDMSAAAAVELRAACARVLKGCYNAAL